MNDYNFAGIYCYILLVRVFKISFTVYISGKRYVSSIPQDFTYTLINSMR